eukprot:1391121-Amphidinium_carterae.1
MAEGEGSKTLKANRMPTLCPLHQQYQQAWLWLERDCLTASRVGHGKAIANSTKGRVLCKPNSTKNLRCTWDCHEKRTTPDK